MCIRDRVQTEDGNTFARLTFVYRYYEPVYAAQSGQQSRVRFSFRVHQSHLYTVSDDGTASYNFTPGWFDDLCVDQLTIRWKAADGMTADTDTMEDGYYAVSYTLLIRSYSCTPLIYFIPGSAPEAPPALSLSLVPSINANCEIGFS